MILRIFILLLLLTPFFFQPIFAQSGYISRYLFEQEETPVAITEARDSGVVVLANTQNPFTGKDLMLVKFNQQGGVVWSNTFPKHRPQTAVELLPSSTGGFYAFGWTEYGGSGSDRVSIWHVNENGVITSENWFFMSGYDLRLNGAAINENGQIALAAKAVLISTGQERAITFCVDTNFVIQWTYIWEIEVVSASGVTANGNQGWIFTFERDDFLPMEWGLAKIDLAGSIIWAHYYFFNTGAFDCGQPVLNSDGSIMVSGSIRAAWGKYSAAMVKFDSLGNVQFVRNWSLDQLAHSFAGKVAEDPVSGDFLMSGWQELGPGGVSGPFVVCYSSFYGMPKFHYRGPKIFRFGSDGFLLSAGSVSDFISPMADLQVYRFQLANPSTCIPTDTLSLESMAITETTWITTPTSYPLIFGVDSISMEVGPVITHLDCYIPTGVTNPKEENLLEIWPSPAGEEVNIRQKGQRVTGTILLYDLSGKVLKRAEMMGEVETINTKCLVSGLYLIRFEGDSGTVHNQKLMVRHP